MSIRLMEQICKGALGYELVMRGFFLFELDDHSVCLEYENGKQWFFLWNTPIIRIRETAVEYLKKRGKL